MIRLALAALLLAPAAYGQAPSAAPATAVVRFVLCAEPDSEDCAEIEVPSREGCGNPTSLAVRFVQSWRRWNGSAAILHEHSVSCRMLE